MRTVIAITGWETKEVFGSAWGILDVNTGEFLSEKAIKFLISKGENTKKHKLSDLRAYIELIEKEKGV